MFLLRRNRAFTLIELLIVIAIILILVAIGLPNFTRARVRAQVTDVMSGMRSLSTALEAYHSQYDHWINPYFPQYPDPEPFHMRLAFLAIEGTDRSGDPFPPTHNVGQQLTTPNKFLNEIPKDPFWTTLLQSDRLEGGGQVSYSDIFTFIQGANVQRSSSSFTTNIGNNPGHSPPLWASNIPPVGAFYIEYWIMSIGPNNEIDQGSFIHAGIYDPTNGTFSYGDIHYLAPYGFMGNGLWVSQKGYPYGRPQ